MLAEKKVAIVTGATKGIGRAVVMRLVKSGIFVVANHLNDDQAASSLLKELSQYRGRLTIIKGDIGSPSTIQNVFTAALDEYGGVDFLVNNAGSYNRKFLNEITSIDFEEKLKVNLFSALTLCQMVAPVMKNRGSGKIVTVSSVVALRGSSYSLHYAMAKAALIGMTKNLARELAPQITVNCVAPGMIETSLIIKDKPEQRKERLDSIPLKRLGCPEDVAGVIFFLLGPDADYITGETINVSGGFYI